MRSVGGAPHLQLVVSILFYNFLERGRPLPFAVPLSTSKHRTLYHFFHPEQTRTRTQLERERDQLHYFLHTLPFLQKKKTSYRAGFDFCYRPERVILPCGTCDFGSFAVPWQIA